jgi:hypothetical protein
MRDPAPRAGLEETDITADRSRQTCEWWTNEISYHGNRRFLNKGFGSALFIIARGLEGVWMK